MEVLYCMKGFKLYLIVISFSLFVMGCTELTKTDVYIKQGYSIAKNAKIAIGYFNVRTNTPYIRFNFKEQLEYHLLKKSYNVIENNKIKQYYKNNNINFNKNLTPNEIINVSKEIPFSLFIQGIIYEVDRSLYDDKNYIIVHLNLFSPNGEKLSTVRYIYHGDRSLISGELIDESINVMLDKLLKK